jgi:hypothetical protein
MTFSALRCAVAFGEYSQAVLINSLGIEVSDRLKAIVLQCKQIELFVPLKNIRHIHLNSAIPIDIKHLKLQV